MWLSAVRHHLIDGASVCVENVAGAPTAYAHILLGDGHCCVDNIQFRTVVG